MESKNKETYNKQTRKKAPNSFLRFTSMTVQMAIIILIGVFGGIKLDEVLELQTPIFTLLLSLVSVGAALYIIIKDIGR